MMIIIVIITILVDSISSEVVCTFDSSSDEDGLLTSFYSNL